MEKVAMSRFEPDEFINDRYAAMEQRLQVRCRIKPTRPTQITGYGTSTVGCCGLAAGSYCLYMTDHITIC
jgi:hypothetical protein